MKSTDMTAEELWFVYGKGTIFLTLFGQVEYTIEWAEYKRNDLGNNVFVRLGVSYDYISYSGITKRVMGFFPANYRPLTVRISHNPRLLRQ
jgi:hypothetical protein